MWKVCRNILKPILQGPIEAYNNSLEKYNKDIKEALKCADPSLLELVVSPTLPEQDKIFDMLQKIGDHKVIMRIEALKKRVTTAEAVIQFELWKANTADEKKTLNPESIAAMRPVRQAMKECSLITVEKMKELPPLDLPGLDLHIYICFGPTWPPKISKPILDTTCF